MFVQINELYVIPNRVPFLELAPRDWEGVPIALFMLNDIIHMRIAFGNLIKLD